MSTSLSTIDPYYLAGIFDQSLNIAFQSSGEIRATICRHRSLLGFVQNLFGGKVKETSSFSLTLGLGALYKIARHLQEIPCRLRPLYIMILEYEDLKKSYTLEYDIKNYQIKYDNLLVQMKNTYELRDSTPISAELLNNKAYTAGFVEASSWIKFAGKKKGVVIRPVGRRQTSLPSPASLVLFIENYSQHLLFRKDLLIRLCSAKSSAEVRSITKDFEQNIILEMSQPQTNTSQQRSANLSIKRAAQKVNARIEKQKRKQALKLSLEAIKSKESSFRETQKREKQLERDAKRKSKKDRIEKEKGLVQNGLNCCRLCDQILPLTSFVKSAKIHTGYSYYCKSCYKERHYLPKKDSIKVLRKRWRDNNVDKVKEIAKRQKAKPHNRIKSSMRRRIKKYLQATNSKDTWRSVTSCTPKELVTHLETQFTPDMSWDNYGSYWHIDHIIPCAAFDPSRPNHLKWCWHYKNLRPLEGGENVDKRDMLSTGEYASDLRVSNPARLKEIVGADLARLGIATAEEFVASFGVTETIRFVEI